MSGVQPVIELVYEFVYIDLTNYLFSLNYHLFGRFGISRLRRAGQVLLAKLQWSAILIQCDVSRYDFFTVNIECIQSCN